MKANSVFMSIDEKRDALECLLMCALAPSSGDYPLSYGQQAMYTMASIAPNQGVYNMSFAARIAAPLDIDRLQIAIDSVCQQHTLLRSTYHCSESKTVRRIRSSYKLPIETCSIDESSPGDIKRALNALSAKHFDLSSAPPIRVVLVATKNKEKILLFSAHHIALDFWSFGIILQDIRTAYKQSSKTISTPSHLADSSDTFNSFVRWQASFCVSKEGQKIFDRWQQIFPAVSHIVALPTDKTPPAVRSFAEEESTFDIDPTLTEGLYRLATEHNTTLFIVLLTLYKLLIYSFTPQQTLYVVAPTAGRHKSEFEQATGYFVNHMIVASQPTDTHEFSDYLDEIKVATLAALEATKIPYQLLLKRLNFNNLAPGQVPLPVKFNMPKAYTLDRQGVGEIEQLQGQVRLPMDDFALELMHIDQRVTATCDLHLSILPIKGRLLGSLQYNPDLFSEEIITSMVERYLAISSSVVKDANRSLHSFIH